MTEDNDEEPVEEEEDKSGKEILEDMWVEKYGKSREEILEEDWEEEMTNLKAEQQAAHIKKLLKSAVDGLKDLDENEIEDIAEAASGIYLF